MSEKLSIFITAVIAAFGWLVTHYVDRLTSAPTVEYRIESKAVPAGYRHFYRLHNLSRTKAFGPIKLNLQAYENNPIQAYRFYPLEPASEGEDASNVQAGAAEFMVPKLLPGAEIVIMLRTAADNRPIMKVDSADVIRLTPRNLETWIVVHEMTVVSILIAIWALMLVVLFVSARSAAAKVPDEAA
ncbi:MAG TPA: hypothetical protein VK472_01140 [Allosphingosinicella sp.]|nr:hypothetical protein [Allosphingosinicella sp.]